jgi:hypothetical protein
MAKMNEEELAIYRAKESAIRSKTRKRKWLGNSGIMTYNDGTRISTLDLSSLGAALGQQWPIRPDFRPVIAQLKRVQAGDEVESSVLILDDEFFQKSRKVFEVALGELNSGKVLLDARVDHECTTEELLAMPDGSALTQKDLLRTPASWAWRRAWRCGLGAQDAFCI